MYDYLVGSTFNFIIRMAEKNSENPAFAKLDYLFDPTNPQRDVMKYGIYIFYINVLKSLLLILVAYFLGVLTPVLVFALPYVLLRLFSFGIHMKTPLGCTILGFVQYLGSVYFVINVGIPFPIQIVAWVICFVCFYLYAPAQTKKRPIPQRQRKPFKIKSMTVLAIIMCVSVYMWFTGNTVPGNLLLLAAVWQTLNILPLTYKIIKQ